MGKKFYFEKILLFTYFLFYIEVSYIIKELIIRYL